MHNECHWSRFRVSITLLRGRCGRSKFAFSFFCFPLCDILKTLCTLVVVTQRETPLIL